MGPPGVSCRGVWSHPLSDFSTSWDVEVGVGFREVSVVEVREVLRAWLAGVGLRTVAQRAGVDRKTARRYVAAAEQAGVGRDGGATQVTDAGLKALAPLTNLVHHDVWPTTLSVPATFDSS